MKLLTISIAAYNVEHYLEKCLSSLDDERFKRDIEVLIIDDGSKDNTKKIAEDFQKKSPDTFHYVPKKNGGHGSTINKGIALAQGKYFRIIDGDDWVDTEEFCKYVEKLKQTDSDLVITQHKEIYPTGEKKIRLVQNMQEGKKYDLNNKVCLNEITLHMLTIKSALLKKHSVRITENCFYVDLEYIAWSIFLSNTVTYYSFFVYMYRMGTQGQSVNKKNMLKNIKMQEKVSLSLTSMYELFKSNGLRVGNKENMIFNIIKRSVGATSRTFLLMEESKKAKLYIKKFDQNIKSTSPIVFKKLEKDFYIIFERKNNYLFIPLMSALYKIWCLKYE